VLNRFTLVMEFAIDKHYFLLHFDLVSIIEPLQQNIWFICSVTHTNLQLMLKLEQQLKLSKCKI